MTPPVDTVLTYSDNETNTFVSKINDLNVDKSYYLILLLGPYEKGKKGFIKNVASAIDEEIYSVDLDKVITTNEQETYQNIDKLFNQINKQGSKYVHFSNGDRLSGVYTGYSYSVQRYATPQERWLLKAINESEKVIFLELKDRHNLNSTLKRMAQTVIKFDEPNSFVDKFIWKLKQFRVHGHDFESSRKVSV